MILIRANREILLELAVGAERRPTLGPAILSPSLSDCSHRGLNLLYRSRADVGELPYAILTGGEEDEHDFYAWCATYLPHWFPLTGVLTVASTADPAAAWILEGAQAVREMPARLRRAVAAVVVAEARLEARMNGKSRDLTMLAIRSTASYAFARGIFLYEGVSFDRISEGLAKCEFALQQSPRRAAAGSVPFWMLIYTVINGGVSGSLWEAEVGDLLFRLMSADGPPPADAYLHELRKRSWASSSLGRAGATREELVEEVIPAIGAVMANRDLSTMHGDMIAGYLASRLSSVALQHLDFIDEVAPGRPGAVLWYALFSSLYAAQTGGTPEQFFTTKVFRDLNDPKVLPPDISIEELMIPGGVATVRRLRTSGTLVNVQLSPGVVVPVRPSPVATSNPSAYPKVQKTAEPPLDAELLAAVERLVRVYSSRTSRTAPPSTLWPAAEAERAARKKRD